MLTSKAMMAISIGVLASLVGALPAAALTQKRVQREVPGSKGRRYAR